MLFSHPFPVGPEGQLWAREAAEAAFISYNRKEEILLDKDSCKFLNVHHPHVIDVHNSRRLQTEHREYCKFIVHF